MTYISKLCLFVCSFFFIAPYLSKIDNLHEVFLLAFFFLFVLKINPYNLLYILLIYTYTINIFNFLHIIKKITIIKKKSTIKLMTITKKATIKMIMIEKKAQFGENLAKEIFFFFMK